MEADSQTSGGGLSRLLAFHSVDYLLRTLRSIGPLFNFDYERMIIALSVTMENTRDIIESPEALAPYRDLMAVIPGDIQRPVTRLEITRATGLPRETVRRKVAQLIDAGVLVKDDRGGVRLTPGMLRSSPMLEVVTQNQNDLFRLFEQVRPILDADKA